MKVDIKVPSVGESITEATISQWVKKSGDQVRRDDVLLVLETDKASVEVVAENDGALITSAAEGDVVQVGAVVGSIDTAKAASTMAPATTPSTPKTPPPKAQPMAAARPPTPEGLAPSVRRIASETNVDMSLVQGTGRGGRITKGDALAAIQTSQGLGATASPMANGSPSVKATPPASAPVFAPRILSEERQERIPMTNIRKRIAERLVQAQHTAAILTTFNEVDMSALMDIRKRYKEAFKEKYNVNLGFMGFFVKAVIEALRTYPRVNGQIDGSDIVLNHHHHIGIAVGTEKGLLVPVIKHADQMSVAQIELAIKAFAGKARDGKITPDDLSGGTFTISNGGVYGSLLSTPILNPPQSGILGMHKIEDRPVALNGQVVIRPMMYLALSYDHRMIDGAESVSFLVRVKECLEEPARILIEI